MSNIIKKKQTAIINFTLPLILVLIGFIIYRDYGISLDEQITRNNGLVSIKYICDFLLPQYTCNFESIKNVPNLVKQKQNVPKHHGNVPKLYENVPNTFVSNKSIS